MAPKRKQAEKPKATPPSLSPRRTRSRTAAGSATPTDAPAKRNKSPKKSPAKKHKLSKKSPDMLAEAPTAENGSTEVAEEQAQTDSFKTSSKPVIVIEACKQCQSFKRTAEKVKKGLEEGLTDITVHINTDKPRRGCFEVREENAETFVSLLDMPRPFKKMKDLDLDMVVSDIINKVR